MKDQDEPRWEGAHHVTPAPARLSRRRLLAWGGLGAASLLAACQGSPVAPTTRPLPATPAATPRAAAAPAPPVSLGWAVPGNPAEVAVYEKLARRAEVTNPTVTITTSQQAADYATMTTLLAAGTAPDLLFCTINNWPAIAAPKVLRPLDDIIATSRFDLNDFYPQIIRPYRYDDTLGAFGQGRLHGLPKEIAVRAMYYNADLFRAAKVALPAPDAAYTWEQFLAVTRSLTLREGDQITQYGYVPEIWWGMWAIWAWANGGQVVDNVYKPTKATMDDPNVVEALTFWSELVTKHRVAAPPAALQGRSRAEMFASGMAATYNNGRWMVPLFRNVAFAWDVMPMPSQRQRAQLLTGSIFGINQASRNPDATWQLLSYITGKEGQLLLTELGVLQPSRRSVAGSEVFLRSAPPTANHIYLDELVHAQPLPLHPKYPEM
jgi:multiple sugar transport system substrate-binding protein